MADKKPAEVNLSELRQAVADYMCNEGCSCCRAVQSHDKHKARLAKLLRVGKYKDGSGYNFARYRSKEGEVK